MSVWNLRRFNLRVGPLSRLLHPGISCCHRCGTSWLLVQGHTTSYEPGRACFPLCEKCWAALSPTQRLPHYRRLLDLWISQAETEQEREDLALKTWPRMQLAVMTEELSLIDRRTVAVALLEGCVESAHERAALEALKRPRS